MVIEAMNCAIEILSDSETAQPHSDQLFSLGDRKNRPRLSRGAAVLLLTVHASLLALGAYVHSPTLNEPGHLASGLSHWKLGRFDAYCVNPPLVRMVAAVPILFAGAKTDWHRFHKRDASRAEFEARRRFSCRQPRAIGMVSLACSLGVHSLCLARGLSLLSLGTAALR